MTIDALLVGPSGHGGEGVYVDGLRGHPPDGVRYDVSGDFHQGAAGASCSYMTEVVLNQLVHRIAIPDMGFRALRLNRRYDLVHAHAHPVVLSHLRETPLIMSEGSSSAVYLGDYLGWSPERMRKGYRRARALYHRLGIHDRLLAMERAFRVYVFSAWARDVNLRWGADPQKLEVIPPGFEAPRMGQPRSESPFCFLFIGSDFERKGGFEVIEAFARITRETQSVRLVLAGTDPARVNPDRLVHDWVSAGRKQAALNMLAEMERRELVQRHSWVTQAQLREAVFPQAHAFVMPTYAEGFGFTNVEAMSFALPVITSDVGPMAEIVQGGVTGLLVPPGNVDRLTEAMLEVMQPGRAQALGAAGRTDFLDRFTRERFRRDLGNLYLRALRN